VNTHSGAEGLDSLCWPPGSARAHPPGLLSICWLRGTSFQAV